MSFQSVFPGRVYAALMVMLSVLVCLPASAATSHYAHASGKKIPAGLMAVITKVLVKQAAQDPVYAIAKNGCASLKIGPDGQGLNGCFGQGGPSFSQGKSSIRLHLAAWGRSGKLQTASLQRSKPVANGIEYRGKNLSEWWRVLPTGYEQGFTINQAPEGQGQVVLQLHANHAPRVDHETLTWGNLRYGKLRVIDANGKTLAAHLGAHGNTITLAFDTTGARFPVIIDPTLTTVTAWLQNTMPNAGTTYYVGHKLNVAISGDGNTAVLGAGGPSPSNTLSYSPGYAPNGGNIYIFNRSGDAWSLSKSYSDLDMSSLSKTPSCYNSGDAFGTSVSISRDGTVIVVGAPGTDSPAFCSGTQASNWDTGAAYIFTLETGTWSSGTVSIQGIGDPPNNPNYNITLSSCSFEGTSGTYCNPVGYYNNFWALYFYGDLNRFADTAEHDHFGNSVAVSKDGSTALIGAWGTTDYYHTTGNNWICGYLLYPYNPYTCPIYNYYTDGVAYIYSASGSGWTAATTLLDPDRSSHNNDQFGQTVALSQDGKTALVSSVYPTGGGKAYIFSGTSWGTLTSLTNPGSTGDQFGSSLALSDDGKTALIGAPGTYASNTTGLGAAYIYTSTANSGNWGVYTTFAPSQTSSNANYGSTVALSQTSTATNYNALVTAPGIKSAYLYTIASGSNWPQNTTPTPTQTFSISGQSSTDTTGMNGVSLSDDGYTEMVGNNVYDQLPGMSATLTTNPGVLLKNTDYSTYYTVTNSGTKATPDFRVEMPIPTDPNGNPISVSGYCAYSGLATNTIGYCGTTNHSSGLSGTDCTSDGFTISCDLGAIASGSSETMELDLTSPNISPTPGVSIPLTQKASIVTGTLANTDTLSRSVTTELFSTVYASSPATVTTSEGSPVSVTIMLAGSLQLSITAKSSNQTLLPDGSDPNVPSAITGTSNCTTSGNCTLTLTPTNGVTGTAFVSVTVADKNTPPDTYTTLFQLTVNANSPPTATISGLIDAAASSDAVGTESFTIGGIGALTISVSSDNQTVLPDSGITGASKCTAAGTCTLTLTPPSTQTGTATVTVSVTDSTGSSSSRAFLVTVNPPAVPTTSSTTATTTTPSGSTTTTTNTKSKRSGGGAFAPWSLLALLWLIGFCRRLDRPKRLH